MKAGGCSAFARDLPRLPAARLLGRRYDEDRREGLSLAQSVGWLMASELRAVGVDFSFAPCVDLDYGVSEIIGDRAFHKRSGCGRSLGCGLAWRACARRAWRRSPSTFQGHGAVIADSHVALPVDRRKFVDLEPDIRPYRPLIDNNIARVSWRPMWCFRRSTRCRPACRAAGSRGCCAANWVSMAACSRTICRMAGAAAFGGVIDRAEHAFAAGCDVLPICNDRQAVQSVLEHFGPEAGTAASQARMVRMRARGEPPSNLNSDRQWQQTVANIAGLSAAPPLVLTEGGHDGV